MGAFRVCMLLLGKCKQTEGGKEEGALHLVGKVHLSLQWQRLEAPHAHSLETTTQLCVCMLDVSNDPDSAWPSVLSIPNTTSSIYRPLQTPKKTTQIDTTISHHNPTPQSLHYKLIEYVGLLIIPLSLSVLECARDHGAVRLVCSHLQASKQASK